MMPFSNVRHLSYAEQLEAKLYSEWTQRATLTPIEQAERATEDVQQRRSG